MAQMTIRFLSKDDRQLAEMLLDEVGYEIVSGFGPTLILEIECEKDALLVQERLNHEEIEWRDCDY
jgi:dihydroneopterin aldolase